MINIVFQPKIHVFKILISFIFFTSLITQLKVAICVNSIESQKITTVYVYCLFLSGVEQ